jgi:SAM-dependent methyltransferase
VKTLFLHLLGRLGLLRPTYRGYERLRSLASRDGDTAVGAVPLPPARLRTRVAGTADPGWFLEGGRLAAETLRGVVGGAGTTLEEMSALLDFGCGCGRVTRWLDDLPGEVRGSDLDREAVAWCRENLPFGSFSQNGLEPPLSFRGGDLDLVYSFSVLTHLPVPLQHEWMSELIRVLRPGGLLLVSTHGEHYVDRLNPSERAEFGRGEVVVRFREVAGTNLCTAFHPPEYVRSRLGAGLQLVAETPQGAKGNPYQDVYLFRRPDDGR